MPLPQPAVVIAPGPHLGEGVDRRHREFYLKSPHTVIGPNDPIPYRAALGALSYRAQLGLFFRPTPRHTRADAILSRLESVVLTCELYSIDLLAPGWEGTMWHMRYGEGASFDGACPATDRPVPAGLMSIGGLRLEDAAGSHEVDPARVADFAAYVSRWMELGPNVLLLAGSPHGPVLSLDGPEPVVGWDGEARLGPGNRVWARCEPLGAIETAIEEAP